MAEVEANLSEMGLWQPETIDFYRVLGRRDRQLIHSLPDAFKDTRTYPAFVRLRREHLNKLGADTCVEIGEHDYEGWKKIY
jgi:hypothetical protein